MVKEGRNTVNELMKSYVYCFVLIPMVNLEFKAVQVYITPMIPQIKCSPTASPKQ